MLCSFTLCSLNLGSVTLLSLLLIQKAGGWPIPYWNSPASLGFRVVTAVDDSAMTG